MTRSDARAIVAVEIFVEEDEVAPVRIVLEQFDSSVERTVAVRSAPENGNEPLLKSSEISQRFIWCPLPVGNSTLNVSPK